MSKPFSGKILLLMMTMSQLRNLPIWLLYTILLIAFNDTESAKQWAAIIQEHIPNELTDAICSLGPGVPVNDPAIIEALEEVLRERVSIPTAAKQ